MNDKENSSEGNNRLSDKEAEEFLAEKDAILIKNEQNEEHPDVHQAAEDRIDRSTGGLGTLKTKGEQASEIHGANDLEWKNVPLENLPTGGILYQMGVELTIKAASLAEIRHWSTIDEGDMIDMDARLNFIMEKCLRLKSPDGGWLSWKDIIEIDRFYLAFLIHELTFPNGENKLNVNFGCNQQCKGDGSFREQVQIKANMLNLLTIPENVMELYDPNERCFVKHSVKLNEDIKFYLPTTGISSEIKRMIRDARQQNKYIDPLVFRIAPYMIRDWRTLSESGLEKFRHETFKWPRNKLLFVAGKVDQIEKSISLIVKKQCPRCNVVLETPLFFRGGFTIKDLFFISDGSNDLV